MTTSFSPTFLHLWREEGIRSTLLLHLDTSSKCALRLTSTECCDKTTKSLFARTRLTFTPSALTRPSRLEALSTIGPYIDSLVFSFPHTADTFLPPLLNPTTGREVNFLYTPNTTAISVIQRPKYGSPELGDLLTEQYPPIFHAATNVPAFIAAFSYLPNLRHLTISCPNQDPSQRYRRDAVDYALISLRIAIERSPLHRLSKLTLHKLHPSGIQYLRHLPGFGCTPSASRRWRQIRKLKITMDSWEFGHTGLDHLKILEDYIRSFSSNLERVSFGWNGRKGPCPFTLFTDPLFSPPKEAGKLFCEVTSPMSPLPPAPTKPAMYFPKLQHMQMRNATMSSDQVSNFVAAHGHIVREFDFENVFLINGGIWEEAMAPLTDQDKDKDSSEEWLSQQSGSELNSSFSSNDDFDRFIQSAIDEVIDTEISDIPIGFGYTQLPAAVPPQARDSVEVTKMQREKKRVKRRKRKHNHPKTPASSTLKISAPIPIPMPMPMPMSMPMPVRISSPLIPSQPSISEECEETEVEPPLILLQPTTFTPNTSPKKHNNKTTTTTTSPYHQNHNTTTNNNNNTMNPHIQGVQRNLTLEATQEELANDPEKRVSALKKAREAVLSKLGKEFYKGASVASGRGLLFKNTCSGASGRFGVGGSSSALVPLMFAR